MFESSPIGSHDNRADTCDALDDITDYLTALGAYGTCSRNSDCDEVECKDDEGDELKLTLLPCRSHPGVHLELRYSGETQLSRTFSDESTTVQVSVNNFTFDLIVTVRDRHNEISLKVSALLTDWS